MLNQKLNILLLGSGAREHSIAKSLLKSPHLNELYVAPGNAGIAKEVTCLDLSISDHDSVIKKAKELNIDLTFVGPEDPLALGIVDAFEGEGLAIIGPNQHLAQLESSKEWSKNVMKEAGIPTADYEVFTNLDTAKNYLHSKNSYPIVIKASGLAAGKGVTVAKCEEEAFDALKACFVDEKFGKAGAEVVIEAFLEGFETSIFAFSDGKTIRPMIAAQDHKAAFEGDTGPNTGGMGAYAPTPLVTKEIYEQAIKDVFDPLEAYFKAKNWSYKGIIYAGLMIDNSGKGSVVEFNARFGDPETQVVLPLLKTDLLEIFWAMHLQQLDSIKLEWEDAFAVCVVLAAKGYPSSYQKGMPIKQEPFKQKSDICYAGVQDKDGSLVCSGGRILSVINLNKNLKTALDAVYTDLKSLDVSDTFYRTDIAHRALSTKATL